MLSFLSFFAIQFLQLNVATAQQNITVPPVISEDGITSQSGFQNGTESYSDGDLDFTINYPSDWTIGEADSGYNTVVTFESPNGEASVDIRVFPQSVYKSVKDFGNTFKTGDDYTLLAYYRNSTTFLDGKPAFKAIYLTTYNPNVFESAMGYTSSTSKAMFIATLVPEKKSYFAFGYFADPSSFETNLQVAEEMVKTFQIGSTSPIIQEEN